MTVSVVNKENISLPKTDINMREENTYRCEWPLKIEQKRFTEQFTISYDYNFATLKKKKKKADDIIHVRFVRSTLSRLHCQTTPCLLNVNTK